MTKNEKRKDDMFRNTCKSTLLTHFFRNSCFTKRLVVYHPLTNLSFAAVGFLLIIDTLIIILPTKRSVVYNGCYEKGDHPKSASQIPVCYKESNFIFRKADIQAWLTRQQKPFGATLLKAELLQICKQHKPTPSFLLDKILREYGHFCLRLPAYHADLNSIGLIWAMMKGYIARRNVSFKMTDVIQLTHDAM